MQGTGLTAYAPGRLIVGSVSPTGVVRDLSRTGYDFAGTIFEGYVSGERLGDVMTGGKDMNGDGFSDFILVAPKCKTITFFSFFPSGPAEGDQGEAYLVYSRGKNLRWPQRQAIDIGTLGTHNNLDGVKFIGPQYTHTSSGIREVLMIDDVDGDGQPEIVFGCPDIDRIGEDQQDYDPLDSATIHGQTPPAPVGWQAGVYYFQTDGWQHCSDSPDILNPTGDDLRQDGFPECDNIPNVGKRSGMIVYVSGGSPMANQVVQLDEVGGRAIWVMRGIARGTGMRVYPNAMSDTTQWGAQMATSDLLGSLYPVLLVARPDNDNGTGSVKIVVQQQNGPAVQGLGGGPELAALAGTAEGLDRAGG